MTEKDPEDRAAQWLSVIGRALAYLCVQEAERKQPNKFGSVFEKGEIPSRVGAQPPRRGSCDWKLT
jgi:hypothetical protein